MNIKKLSYDSLSVYLADIPAGEASRRQRERHTVAALARHAISDSSTVCHTESGAPYIRNIEASISVSHSQFTAALAVGRPGILLGVDIESAREQLRRVAPRVLSERELQIYGSSMDMLLAAWTLKEAAYKAAGIPGLDFRLGIELPDSPSAARYVRAADKALAIVACTEIDGQWLSLVSSPQP